MLSNLSRLCSNLYCMTNNNLCCQSCY
uniref:Uncharacterized protein n=1 Tax=Arundo donax TaxID=35708 RepID=A0A0A9BGV8_ARUDO